MIKKVVIYIFFLLFCLRVSAQTNKEIKVYQQGQMVVIEYSLSERSDVNLYISRNGGRDYQGPLKNVTGDIGRSIRPGTALKIYWDPIKEYDEITENNITFKVKLTKNSGVDLGLPSGTMWAENNFEANSSNILGRNCMWEEIYYNYIHPIESYDTYFAPVQFSISDKGWLPTNEQLEELRTCCKWMLVNKGSTFGYNVIGPNGNSIFIPLDKKYHQEYDDKGNTSFISGFAIWSTSGGQLECKSKDLEIKKNCSYDKKNYIRLVTTAPDDSKEIRLNALKRNYEESRKPFDEREKDIPFQYTEIKPHFMGLDFNYFSMWFSSQLRYPKIAQENGVQGRIMTQFTIDINGAITNIKILRGVDESLDKEAIRVISSSPKWYPGFQRDRAVKVSYTFPVIFQLN